MLLASAKGRVLVKNHTACWSTRINCFTVGLNCNKSEGVKGVGLVETPALFSPWLISQEIQIDRRRVENNNQPIKANLTYVVEGDDGNADDYLSTLSSEKSPSIPFPSWMSQRKDYAYISVTSIACCSHTHTHTHTHTIFYSENNYKYPSFKGKLIPGCAVKAYGQWQYSSSALGKDGEGIWAMAV